MQDLDLPDGAQDFDPEQMVILIDIHKNFPELVPGSGALFRRGP